MKISATLLVIFAAGTNANATPDPVDYTPIALRSEQEDAGAATGLGWTPREGFYGDGYGHPSSDGALSEDLVHGRELQQAQCCSAGGIACFFAGCSVCAPCQHCLGPQALLPWCWACAGCIGCAVGCTSYLHCAGASWEHCTNSPPPPSPRPPPPAPGGHPSGSNWIDHNGMRRNFQMGPTTCTSPPCPLVLVMHGWTMSTANMVSSTSMNSRVSAQGRGGAVVVYPDGTGSGLQKCWRVQNAEPPPFPAARTRPLTTLVTSPP